MLTMPASQYQSYLESEVLSADPLKLVKIVYVAILDSVQSARRYLSTGEIAERSAAITKAIALLQELSSSLDHEKGGEISRNLVELYDYMQRQLLRANTQQTDAPLAEVHNLVSTLLEAWQAVAAAASEPMEPADNPLPLVNPYGEEPVYRSVSYSF